MNKDRWLDVRENIKKQFEVEYQGEEELVGEPGSMEVMEFDGPMGFMRVEYVTRPKTVGRKVGGARRGGAQSKENMVYSLDEQVSRLHIYKWNEEESSWEEIKEELFS